MPQIGEPFPACPIADRIKELTQAFVSVPSHTGTLLENGIQGFFQRWFESTDYFTRNPGHCGFFPIPDDHLGRCVVWALVRGSRVSDSGLAARTVVLIHHSDTADIQDFGPLQGKAYDPMAITDCLMELQGSGERVFPEEVAADLTSGDWLFGRGVCDMKGGGAIEMALLEQFAQTGDLEGTLLLLSLPDEENLSAGMRAATLLMKDLKVRFGLDYRLMINTEPHTRLAPATGVLYEGSVGKIMPLVYVKGQAAHVSQVFNGFNPVLLLSEIVRRTELNPAFMETSGRESTLPPVWLYVKDRKNYYDVSLPLSAAGYLSILSLEKSPREHLDRLQGICLDAFHAVIAQMDASYEAYARNLGVELPPLPWRPDVRTFEELHQSALERAGEGYTEAVRTRLAELKDQIAQGEMGIPEAGYAMVELALEFSGLTTPVVVIALSPPYYPSVSNRQMREQLEAAGSSSSPFLQLAGLSDTLIAHARETWGQDYTCVDFFTGLSDLSYAIYRFDKATMEFTKGVMPLWGEIYSIPFETIQELSVPVINIGPWGKDFHKNTERVYVPDLCERTPALIQRALRHVFGLALGGV